LYLHNLLFFASIQSQLFCICTIFTFFALVHSQPFCVCTIATFSGISTKTFFASPQSRLFFCICTFSTFLHLHNLNLFAFPQNFLLLQSAKHPSKWGCNEVIPEWFEKPLVLCIIGLIPQNGFLEHSKKTIPRVAFR